MPSVVFVAPVLSENAQRMVTAVASLPDVRLGVISGDPQENAPAELRAGIAAHWRVDDVLDSGQLLWAAENLSRQLGPIHRMFGAYEQLQVPLAEARQRLGIEGLTVEAAMNFRDKSRMKDVLRAAGLPTARHQLVERIEQARAFTERVGFPVVVKPPAGAGSLDTFKAEHADALHDALRRTPPAPGRAVLLEEFVTGDEHSLETISVDGRPVFHSLTHYIPSPLEVMRNPWIQWCVVLPREADEPQYDDARRAGDAALRALGMRTGLSHMEWFRRKDGSVAISEIAARPPGAQITTLISRAHDMDFVREWARVMVYSQFEAPPRKYAVGCAYLRGQGRAGGAGGSGRRVTAIRGLDEAAQAVGALVTDVKLPSLGQGPGANYEGEGYVIVRHPETRVVVQAVQRLVSLIRVDMG